MQIKGYKKKREAKLSMSKKKAITLLIVILLIVAILCTLTFASFSFGIYNYNAPFSNIPLGIELSGGVYVVFEASIPEVDGEPMYDSSDLESHISSTMGILEERLYAAGYTEATVSTSSGNKIRVEVANVGTGQIASQDVFDIIGTPAVLEFIDPDGNVVVSGQAGDIKSAAAGYDSSSQEYLVMLEFTTEGSVKFAEATANCVGETISIYLDDELISSPTVNEAITGGTATISGSFTYDEANALAVQIQGGALTVDLTTIEQATVSATLGDDAINSSIIAACLGLLLIFLYIFFMYGGFGFVINFSLLIYTTLLVFVLGSMELTQLSLAGIAGMILSIGMAVDANVIIFERIKDEYSMGKNIPDSVINGFKKSTSAILDANITTIIASTVLILLGTATIKAFAVTLLTGIVISLFTSLIVSRLIANLFISINNTNNKFYKLSRGDN